MIRMLLRALNRPVLQVFSGIAAILIILMSTVDAAEGSGGGTVSARVTWPPVLEAGVAGYRIHYGIESGSYTHVIDVGNTTAALLPDLTVGITYYCALTLYSTSGISSSFSDEISFVATEPDSDDAGYLVIMEGESGSLTGSMTEGLELENTAHGTLVTTRWVQALDTSPDSETAIPFEAEVADHYVAWCRVRAGDEAGDSFLVAMDDGPEHLYHVHGSSTPSGDPYSDEWIWSRIDIASGDPLLFELTEGSHVMSFRVNEAGTTLDRVILSSDPLFTPSDQLIGGADILAITLQPENLTLTEGATATLVARASANGPVTYQWQKDGAPITGATGSSLHISNFQTSDSGAYAVVASTGSSAVWSDVATIGVAAPPPTILAFELNQAGGVVSVSLDIANGLDSDIEVYASSDLVSWVLLGTPTNTTGTVTVDDPQGVGAPRRFYRLGTP